MKIIRILFPIIIFCLVGIIGLNIHFIKNSKDLVKVQNDIRNVKESSEDLDKRTQEATEELNVAVNTINEYSDELKPLQEVSKIMDDRKDIYTVIRNFPTIYYNTKYDNNTNKYITNRTHVRNALISASTAVPYVGLVLDIMLRCANYNSLRYFDYMTYANNTIQSQMTQPLANFSASMTELRSQYDFYASMLEDNSWSGRLENARRLKNYNDITTRMDIDAKTVIRDATVLYYNYDAIRRVYYFILDFQSSSNDAFLDEITDMQSQLKTLAEKLSGKDISELISKEDVFNIQKPYIDLYRDVVMQSASTALGEDITGMNIRKQYMHDRNGYGVGDFRLQTIFKEMKDTRVFVVSHELLQGNHWLRTYYDPFAEPIYVEFENSYLYYDGDGNCIKCIKNQLDQEYERKLHGALVTIRHEVRGNNGTDEIFCKAMGPLFSTYDEHVVSSNKEEIEADEEDEEDEEDEVEEEDEVKEEESDENN